MHSLIIEDESMIAMAIEDVLRDIGFLTFDIASSPQAAIDCAARQRPDLITSDVQLNPGCGIQTVLSICKNLVIPVVFITGNVADVLRQIPGSRAINKPFSEAQLQAAVALALK